MDRRFPLFFFLLASVSFFGIGCEKKRAASPSSQAARTAQAVVTPASNQGVLTFPPARPPSASVNVELYGILNAFRALKSFRTRFAISTPQGPLKANLEFVKPHRFHGVIETGTAGTVELIAVDASLYMRAQNATWIDVSRAPSSQALQAALKDVFGGGSGLDAVLIDDASVVKKSRDARRKCDLYTTTARNAASNAAKLELCAVNGLPKHVTIKGDKTPLEFEYYDYNTIFVIERPI